MGVRDKNRKNKKKKKGGTISKNTVYISTQDVAFNAHVSKTLYRGHGVTKVV